MSERAFVALADLEEFRGPSYDLAELLNRPDNADISDRFPLTVERFKSGFAGEFYLAKTKELCEPGVREQFIIFSGQTAVGMSIVTVSALPREGVDPSWPNLSGFICNPYRRQGLGIFSLQERLKVVDQRFGGEAWTAVDMDNIASQRMVEAAGLKLIGDYTDEDGAKFLYTYSAGCAK